MKILFVLENYLPHIGGVEIVFKNLSEGLVKLGHEVSIVTHRIKGTKRFEIIRGVKIHRVDCFNSRYWFTFLSIPTIINLVKEFDIIHTTSFNGAPPAWLVSKITRKKCMITIHEVWINKWDKLTKMGWINCKIHNILEQFIYLLNFDRYVCVSKSTQHQLICHGISKDKTSVIYNGVDYEHWKPENYNGKQIREELKLENNFVYLFSGRPGISKGLEYLIKAVNSISERIPNSKLLAIVSNDKTYEKRYKYIISLIKKLKLDDKVILLNPVSYKNLPSYLKAADCVVVPSLAEGFGFAVAEACVMDIPVVASNTTSIPEVISGKYILVKPKSTKELVEGIIKVFNHEFKITPLKKFKIDENITNYLREYQKLFKKNAGEN
jgi:D-inositol-3-phosphate glycosyltransferase